MVITAPTRGLVRFHNTCRLTRLPLTCLAQTTQKGKGQNHSRLAGQPQVSLSGKPLQHSRATRHTAIQELGQETHIAQAQELSAPQEPVSLVTKPQAEYLWSLQRTRSYKSNCAQGSPKYTEPYGTHSSPNPDAISYSGGRFYHDNVAFDTADNYSNQVNGCGRYFHKTETAVFLVPQALPKPCYKPI